MSSSTLVRKEPGASGLAEVIDIILDKGLVIDGYVRVSLLGLELLTIDLRIVVASVDTYLRFAEAVGRLQLSQNEPKELPEFVEGMTSSVASGKTKGVISGAKEKVGEEVRDIGHKVKDTFTRDGDDEQDSENE